MKSKSERTKDKYGRPLVSLRISVTGNCNLNCFYCHEEGCSGSGREMNPEEIEKLVKVATEFGMRKIKLTGGEPLIRDDIIEIVSSISQLGVTDISITTNGIELSEKARRLREAGLDRVNISLDTLNPEKYEQITGEPLLERVLEGVDSAIKQDLSPIKLNSIVLKGINTQEVDSLIEYSMSKGLVLQLIELEKVLPKNKDIFEKYHQDLQEVEERVREESIDVRTRWLMQARRKYMMEDGGEIEIINPMHDSEFCSHCTRLRVTPQGRLKPCLMRNDNLVDTIEYLQDDDIEEIREAFETAIERREPYFTKSSDKK